MAFSPTSTMPAYQIPAFDYNSLSSFYTTGAFMGNAKHADKLASGALKDILAIDPNAPIAPWQLTQVKEGEVIDRVFSGKPLIDLNDPLFDRDDVDDNFKNLFALYKGLSRIEELTQFAETRDGNALGELLQRQFDSYLKEIDTFLGTAKFSDIALVGGLKTDTLKSTITIPPATADNAYVGEVVATDTTTALSSLSAADELTIAVTVASVTTNVTVSLSSAASLSLDDIVTQINSDLVAAGFSSTFSTKYHADSKYGLQADFASGESLSLSHAAAAESKAVYVTGRAGAGEYADGFVVKLDDLGTADPTQEFYQNISSTYDGEFHMDTSHGVAVDSVGNVYSVGSTQGDMDGMINVDGSDVFLRKYDASGNLLFTRMLGSNQSAVGFKVTVDSSDNVIVAGQTGGALTQAAYDSGLDNFVSKFDSDGEELWTRQLGPAATDGALDVTVDASGNIYTSGFTYGAMTTSETYGGGSDAFVTKLNSSGVLQFHKQFDSTGDEKATAIAINSGGDILVAGMTDANGFLRKYNASDASLAHSTDLGAVGTDGDITGIAIDSNNDVYLSGYSTNAALSGTVTNAHAGGTDGFVLHIDDQAGSASINYVAYVGTTSSDKSFGVAVDTSDNSFYVTGSTEGTLSGEAKIADMDAYVAKFSSAGALAYTHQFGGGQNHQGFDIAFDSDGTNTLSKLGLPGGPIPVENSLNVGARTTVRADQVFYLSVNGAESKVTIEADDSFGFLAYKINKILGIQGLASLDQEVDNRTFQIAARDGAEIEIRSGPGNFNALPGLGFVETRLFGKFEEGDRVGELSADDMAFALGIISGLKVNTTDKATEALTIFSNAMREVKAAHKFLTVGPESEDDFAVQGQVSEYTRSRIAAYQGALTAMQNMNIQPLTSTSLRF